MSDVVLNERFLAKIAGWEAMKLARGYLEAGQVLSSDWKAPILKGVVQDGPVSYRAALRITSDVEVDNLCTCRTAREWGTICAHAVAVGLHQLQGPPAPAAASPPSARRPASRLQRDCQKGEAAELFVIFPPNLEQALARGKIALCLEVKWRGGRVPLNALPQQPFCFAAPDLALLDQIENLANGETPAMVMVEKKDLAALLPAMVDHPRLTLGRSAPVQVTRTPWPLALKAVLESNGEIQLALTPPRTLPALLDGGWIFEKQTFQTLALPAACLEIFRGPVRIPRVQVPPFLNQDWPRLEAAGRVEANFKPTDFTVEPQRPRFLLELKGGLAQLSALLQCAYGPRILTPGVTAAQESFWLPDPASPTRYITRDVAAEQEAMGRLRRAGFAGPDAQGRLQLLGQNPVLNFFAREFPKMEREWEVTLEERLERSTATNLERIEPRFQITPSGVQWFDLAVSYDTSGGEKFSPADIQRLLLSGQSHTRLRNGRIALIDTGAVEELQEVLLDASPQQHAAGYRLSQTQAGFIEATLRQQAHWQVQAPAAWRERARQQSGETQLECPPLGPLEDVLRPYQKAGVAWLQFLRQNGFGGILADEMGLGKTLQVLAHLASARSAECGVRNEEVASKDPATVQSITAGPGTPRFTTEAESTPHSALRTPHLVVCPTSLVFNWVAEAKKFTPGLRVLALQGAERQELFKNIPQHDLVISSYALIRRDAERYRDLEFDTVVLDEAQHIKNRQTQNAQAVKSIRAQHRLVLTGTPMENSVLDLWSIFDFLMPGYLGTARDFRDRYEGPIMREKNAEVQVRLARRLRPFLRRRLKRDVARDLPEKLEQVSFCELTDEQRAVYGQVLEASRKEVMDAVGAQGLARSRMVILNALLRLRQICCDLRLLKLDRATPLAGASGPLAPIGGEGWGEGEHHSVAREQDQQAEEKISGKMELFGELLEEIMDGGHRVLVFSQFVSMLTLLRERLTAEGVEFCYLDGSTTNRGEVVERFQSTPSIPAFLISLKAGGVGLNLTGADTVIHFDPWWNPAVEDQATDRAHRIGQKRVVTSYKLITRDTVEEKILTLQQRKRDVIQAMLGSEEQLAGALTWEEIQELFR